MAVQGSGSDSMTAPPTSGADNPPFYAIERIYDIKQEDIHAGHVNNARFFHYINCAMSDWYSGVGISSREAHPEGGPSMAHLEYDFLQYVLFPGQLVVKLVVARVGRSSLTHAIEIRSSTQSDALCGRGEAVTVWIDRQTGRSAPWPDSVLARFWPQKVSPADS